MSDPASAALLPVPGATMRAILQPAYGPPDVLVQAVVPRPPLREDGVLVRIVACSLHRGDWHLLTGTPWLLRAAGFGLTRPNQPIPGMAIAGHVEAVGAVVRDFRAGDDVFGEINRGGFAEYVCVKEAELARKPAAVSFEDAAALPVSATTALQGLRDAGRLQPGQSVLVNGAAGGVGTFAVQIGKALGAEVTGVCSGANVGLVRSLGADHVIDYGEADFTRGERRYDVVFDLVGNHPRAALRRVLGPKGRLVAAGGGENRWVGPMLSILTGMASNLLSAQPFVPLINKPNRADLTTVAEWVEAGRIRPAIDRRYALADVADGMRVLGTGRARGKSVVVL